MPTSDKTSSLLGQFVRLKENGVLWKRSQGPYSQNLIFFVTYKQAKYVSEFVPGKPFQLSVMQEFSLLSRLIQ